MPFISSIKNYHIVKRNGIKGLSNPFIQVRESIASGGNAPSGPKQPGT